MVLSIVLSACRHDNALSKTLNCIERATNEVSVFVCDHSRNEAANEQFQWANPDISVLFRKKKIHYTEAINSIPAERLPRYLIVMDPGIVFDTDLLSRMITYMDSHPAIAVLSPLVTDSKGMEVPLPKRELSVRHLISMLFRRPSGMTGSWYKSFTMTDRVVTAPVPVQTASSRFMFIRTDVFTRLGGFNSSYDRFLADFDFCQRILTNHAGSIVWHPEMPVIQTDSLRSGGESVLLKLISVIRYSLCWHIRW